MGPTRGIGFIWPLMAAPPSLDNNIRKFEEIGTHPAATQVEPYRLPASAHVGRVRLTVSDLERSVDFYGQVIGLALLNPGTPEARCR